MHDEPDQMHKPMLLHDVESAHPPQLVEEQVGVSQVEAAVLQYFPAGQSLLLVQPQIMTAHFPELQSAFVSQKAP